MKRVLIIADLFHISPRILGLKHFHLSRAEQISNEVLSLPIHHELSDEQIEYTINGIGDLYREDKYE